MAASLSSVAVTLSKSVWNKNSLIHTFRRISTTAVCLRTQSSSESGGSSVTESTDEFCFVERLIPPTRVPPPPEHTGPARQDGPHPQKRLHHCPT
ncbi:hypothetical protein AMELA_G00149030 [Ameiurus melas]|uniref:Uncharacterized protein n=1 Tax=Ameiurus melas TaxID=219545 RepID=A0A7J6AH13_AMEME|nr:hypothetical protein AMELA_G00149030 [Ameiurus melas]